MNILLKGLLTFLTVLVGELTLLAQSCFPITPYNYQGTPIDTAVIEVHYKLEYKQDPKSSSKLHQTHILKVGTSYSISYRPTNEEALHAESKEVGLNADGRGLGATIVYANRRSADIEVYSRVIGDKSLRYKEAGYKPTWTIHQDTIRLQGYLCHKATAKIGGRNYTAWFSGEIPFPEGPWKLKGLPGLVFKAEDEYGDYQFTCTALQYRRSAIAHPSGDYPIRTKEEVLKLYRQLYRNPKSVVSLLSRGQVKWGAIPSSLPHNPMELE